MLFFLGGCFGLNLFKPLHDLHGDRLAAGCQVRYQIDQTEEGLFRVVGNHFMSVVFVK